MDAPDIPSADDRARPIFDQCQPNYAIVSYAQLVYVPTSVSTCIHYGLRQPLRIRKAQFMAAGSLH
jgi:hypothetical protein